MSETLTDFASVRADVVLVCDSVLVVRAALVCCLFFQAEDGIRVLVRSRGLGDVYKRQW